MTPSLESFQLWQAESEPYQSDEAPSRLLKCYVVSDVHLTNQPFKDGRVSERLRQKNFIDFLHRIELNLKPDQELLLILNGDILDINGSWYGLVPPWDDNRDHVESLYLAILSEILQNNRKAVDALRTLLDNPAVEVVYTIGNHDYLLEEFVSGQDLIRQVLLPDLGSDDSPSHRLQFVEHYIHPELGLYVEHGHRLDPFNSYLVERFPPLGEIINVSIVNQLPRVVSERMTARQDPPELVKFVGRQLAEIEFLRPLSLFPLWISRTARQSQENFLSKNQTCEDAHQGDLESLIREAILDLINDQHILEFFATKLKLPPWLLVSIVRLVLAVPITLPILSYVISKIIRNHHANDVQFQKALEIHREKGVRFVVFGHTHRPSAKPLNDDGYYFNTGSWTPVVYYTKPESDFIAPEIFNRVDHCGILRFEHKLNVPHAETAFYLETVRSGQLSDLNEEVNL